MHVQIAKVGIAIRVRRRAAVIGHGQCRECYDLITRWNDCIGRAVVFSRLCTFLRLL